MDLSVIVPVCNERENLEQLHEEIVAAMDGLGPGHVYEVIYVDDGSQDGSREVLRRIHAAASRVPVVFLRKNFGQTAAMSAGFRQAAGAIIITLDGDLQNDPADIPALLDKLEEGFDLVTGWRRDRKDEFLRRRLPSLIANWIIRRATHVKVHDYGCMLKVYRAEIAKGLRLYGEMHRFIPAYAGAVGAKIVEVPVTHHPRRYGKAKYGLERTLKVVLDLFTVKFLMSYAKKPIYLFGGTGMALIFGSTILVGVLVVRRITVGEHLIRSPLLLMSVMLFIVGFQSILMGLIAELLVRTYHESQAKPIYTVRKALGKAERGD